MKRRVLITGASGGIGRALVSRFERAGWEVLGCDRSSTGDAAVDVTDEASVRALRQRAGVPEVLINNAGIGLLGPVAELPDEELARQLDVNVRGVARLVRAFAPGMCARGHGRIINVGSMAGLASLPWFGAYAASKHAVEGLSDALRIELQPFGVAVSLIEPSIVGTGFVDSAVASLERAAPGSTWEAPLRETIARRAAFAALTVTPERVADAVFHAATSRFPRARYRVGWLASLLLRARALLPTFFTDAVLRAVAGFGHARLPASLETRS